ncbi:kinase [Labrys miyagiensis]|uniref:GHMP family kinase ATP-binding protein n=1 Tax=Labrys miyagiensis TaxID=346912 RepID=UPI0024E14F82|nr:kinase [Labrys miyagiensis]
MKNSFILARSFLQWDKAMTRQIGSDRHRCFNGSKNSPGVGYAKAIAHHGELLQGVFEGQDGRLHRGLLTLPMSLRHSQATFWPSKEVGVRTRPGDRLKASRAALATLEYLGLNGCGADLTLESDIPVGHGYGSSTADVVAAIRATATALDTELRRSTICRLAIASEAASDAIVYADQAVLFAHREGFVLEHFGDEYPPLVVVGFQDLQAVPIDTLSTRRARFDIEEIEIFRVLRGLTSRSIRYQDPRLLGQLATMSARINQRYLPKAGWDRALELARRSQACGIQVAHSGTLFGILLDGMDPAAATRANALADQAAQAGFSAIQVFAINTERRMFA